MIRQLWNSLDSLLFASEYKKMELQQRKQHPQAMFGWHGERGQAVREIALLMLFKDEEDIIAQNLQWHYFLGFRRFVLMNNASVDNSVAKIQAFRQQNSGVELYLIDDPVREYYQDRKTTAMAKMAESLWQSRWVFPVDADEFLMVQHNLAQQLQQLEQKNYKRLLIPLVDFLPKNSTLAVEPLPFYHRLCRYDHTLANHQSKIAFVPAGSYRLSMGNHKLFTDKSMKMANGVAQGFMYRHFPCRSPEQLKRKIINGGKAYRNTDYSEATGDFWKSRYQVYLQQGDQAIDDLYQQLCRKAGRDTAYFDFERCLADSKKTL